MFSLILIPHQFIIHSIYRLDEYKICNRISLVSNSYWYWIFGETYILGLDTVKKQDIKPTMLV
jgi:hypothetical protein